MTYAWKGKGCLQHKGTFYTDGVIIPTGKDGISDVMVKTLLDRGQIKEVSIKDADSSGSASVSLKDAEKAVSNATKRVEDCKAQITKWSDAENTDKTEEWTEKLVQAETDLEAAETIVSGLKAGE